MLAALFLSLQFYVSFHFLMINHETNIAEQGKHIVKQALVKSHDCSVFYLWKNSWVVIHSETSYKLYTYLKHKLSSFIEISHKESLFVYYYLRGPPVKLA